MAKDELTVEEATAITEHAASGSLPLDDPEVRKVVEQANRVLVRAQMWGEDRSRGCADVVACWPSGRS